MDRKITKQIQMLFPYLLIALLSVMALLAAIFFLEKRFRTQTNREMAALVEEIRRTYPDVAETEIIRALREAKNTDVEESETLFRFGYGSTFGEDMFVSDAASSYAHVIKIAVFVWAIALIACLLLFAALRTHLRQKRTDELIAYIRQIADGVYDLKIADNEEGDISILTNEIYKIAVQLKENAEISRKESENLSRALADISHQIRTPLTSVQIMLDTMSDDPDMDSATRQDFLRKCAVQIDAVNALVVTLLQLAKFDSGVVKMNRTLTSIGDLLKEAADALAIFAEVKDVTVSVTGDTDASVNLDAKWELEAYKNLIKNGIEHAKAGGSVILEAEDTPLFLNVSVRDDGEGIAEKDLRHIFERFYQSGTSAKDRFGIGLSLTKTVIENDGAIITADSVLGKGTTFTVCYLKTVEPAV